MDNSNKKLLINANFSEEIDSFKPKHLKWPIIVFCCICLIIIFLLIEGCAYSANVSYKGNIAHLKASWYSVDSLKREGTYKHSKGVMANGHIFSDSGYTCATRLFPLGVVLRVTNSISKSFVYVKVTDRIGKRFGKTRIDLSKSAFERLANLNEGLINVEVTRIY